MKIRHLIIISIASIFPTLLFAQSIEDAKKWYLEGDYAQAKPIFEAEYTANPKNASLNQWLGVIAFNEGEYEKAEHFLQVAALKKVTEAYLYLGMIYSKTYRFGEAEKEFAKYEKANKRKREALAKLDNARAETDKLRRMTHRTEDVVIIDSVVVAKRDLLSAYHLSEASGSLIPIKGDSTNGEVVQFLNEKGSKTFFSKSDSDNEGKIYSKEKLMEKFDNEKRLPESINQQGSSQAYPFVMTDGLTIYFASTGHNTLGGYDLFVTRYNLANDTYLTPNQLNMPFNSTFNDYMMVIDEDKGIGWFASDRFQPKDSVCVYTFVPNQTVLLLENDSNEDHLARRAILSSIRETWKQGVDYSELLSKNQTKRKQEVSEAKDFDFVINDEHTYYNLSDFKSERAKELFKEALTTEKQLTILKERLKAQRNQYATSENRDVTLSTSILTNEKEAENLFHKVQQLRMQARNEEIRNNYL